MKFYRVGGINRDEQLSKIRGVKIKNKDIDGAIDMTDELSADIKVEDMFQVMRAKLIAQGFVEYEVSEENFVVRSHVPTGHPFLQFSNVADFNLCREEGPYSDGRHPDWVAPADIWADLARRDFTGNAIGIAEDGTILDPHNGIADLEAGILRFVGDAEQRIREDGLRVLRALRFMITRDLRPTPETKEILGSEFAADCLFRDSIADERIQQELNKMVRQDSLNSILLLAQYPALLPAIFKGKVRLDCPEFLEGEKQDPENVILTATMRKK